MVPGLLMTILAQQDAETLLLSAGFGFRYRCPRNCSLSQDVDLDMGIFTSRSGILINVCTFEDHYTQAIFYCHY